MTLENPGPSSTGEFTLLPDINAFRFVFGDGRQCLFASEHSSLDNIEIGNGEGDRGGNSRHPLSRSPGDLIYRICISYRSTLVWPARMRFESDRPFGFGFNSVRPAIYSTTRARPTRPLNSPMETPNAEVRAIR